MPEPAPTSQRPGRPVGVLILAALLTFYAMSGVYIAASLAAGRPGVLRWELVALGGAAFAASAGFAARAVWRLADAAPRWLVACGVAGALLCIALAAASQEIPGESPARVWRAAITGALLFVAFLGLAARYVRRQIDTRS